MPPLLIYIALFMLVLALIPLGLKWLQRRVGAGLTGSTSATRIISSVAVGTQQRVVTVEVGPDGQRTWLTLGVTPQSITCLHTDPVGSGSVPIPRIADSGALVP